MTDHSQVPSLDLTKVHGWKDLLFKWLFQQGVSTILLAAILVAAGQGVHYVIHEGIPAYTELIHDGLQKQRSDFSSDLKMLVDQQAKENAANREFYERLLNEIRANRKALEKLPDHLHPKDKT